MASLSEWKRRVLLSGLPLWYVRLLVQQFGTEAGGWVSVIDSSVVPWCIPACVGWNGHTDAGSPSSGCA